MWLQVVKVLTVFSVCAKGSKEMGLGVQSAKLKKGGGGGKVMVFAVHLF